jgi:hypothetical protein
VVLIWGGCRLGVPPPVLKTFRSSESIDGKGKRDNESAFFTPKGSIRKNPTMFHWKNILSILEKGENKT